MKKTIILSSSILIAVNLILGLIITAYSWLNVSFSTIVIIMATIFLLVVNCRLPLKDGYNVGFNCVIPVIGFFQYLLAIFMPSRFSDNWGLIILVVLTAIEAMLLVVANSVSTKIR